jgi:iron complex transport system substrate-binding protein
VTLERLGVADRIIGVGLPEAFGTTTGAERSVLDSLPVLADRIPPTEVVANATPDLLVTAFSALGNAEGSPTRDKLAQMGAAGLSACMPGGASYKASTSSADSLIDDFKPTYDFIERVGQAVGASAAAKDLVAGLEARVAAARPTDGGDPPRVLILTDDPAAGQPLPVSGGASIANAVVEQAGGVNLFKDLGGMHAMASPEELVHRDPQIILVVTGYRTAKVPGDELLAAVRSNPLLRTTSAVRHGLVVSVPQNQVAFPSPLNVDALERLAPLVSKARLADENGS